MSFIKKLFNAIDPFAETIPQEKASQEVVSPEQAKIHQEVEVLLNRTSEILAQQQSILQHFNEQINKMNGQNRQSEPTPAMPINGIAGVVIEQQNNIPPLVHSGSLASGRILGPRYSAPVFVSG